MSRFSEVQADLNTVREYKIATMYRRCCWYTIAGMILIAATAILLDQFALLPKKSELAVTCGILLVCAAFAAIPLFWKLHVDDTGIQRRRILGSDFWSWSDFASGELEKQFRYSIKDASRPFWRRKIGFNYLDTNERFELWNKINSFYQLPPQPEIPEVLEIKYRLWRRMRLDKHGIHLLSGSTIHEALWTEVKYVVAVAHDLKRRDFHRLELDIPNETIELRVVSNHGSPTPNWRGADTEIIFEFLKQHVPNEKFELVTSMSDATNRDYLVNRLSLAQNEIREMRIISWILGPLLLACGVWMAIDAGIWKGLFLGVFYSVLCVPVFMVIYRSKSADVKKIEERVASLKSK